MRRLRVATTMAWVFLPLLAAGLLAAQPPQTRTLAPGDVAPDFTLPGSDGRTYQLSEFRGKQAVVLAWFAKAYSAG
jgi:thioredoxin-dependent peroxiredoxin